MLFVFYRWIWSQNLFSVSNHEELESLHLWNVVAAGVSLFGSPCTMLLLSSGIFVGCTIQSTVNNTSDPPLFFALSSGSSISSVNYLHHKRSEERRHFLLIHASCCPVVALLRSFLDPFKR
jgi:hypothetical protein